MLPFMPNALKKEELETALLDAKAGPCVALQPVFHKVLVALAEHSDESITLRRLFDGMPEAEQLHSALWALRFTPVGNFISETVVKTLEHGIDGRQRRTQQYATMLVAARHRTSCWPMSDADYVWASRETGTSVASRRHVVRKLDLQLTPVNLSNEVADTGQALWILQDALQEDAPLEEGEGEEEGEEGDGGEEGGSESSGVVDVTMGAAIGCAQDPRVKVKDVARILSAGTVIEALWSWTPTGEPE
eukprot:7380349-Prymnesium_polylepis.1